MDEPAVHHDAPNTSGYQPFHFMGVDTQVPGWAIAIGSVIGLLLHCAWGFFAVVAPHLNPLAGVFAGLDGGSAILILVGLLFLLVALFFSQRVLGTHARHTPAWLKACLFVSLLGAIADFSAAPFVTTFHVRSQRASHAEVLRNLETNARVHYVIRLIPYKESEKDFLSITKLANLGRCCDPASADPANQACVKDPDPQRCTKLRYVFVADYAEVRGLKVSEAVERVGGSLDRAVGVSAIIFPLDERSLYPASARGLLQLVNKLDREHANDAGYTSFDLEGRGINTRTELSDTSIPSYSWARTADTYPTQCRVAQEFRCAVQQDRPFSAAFRLGSLSRDWHPLGLARRTEEDPCRPKVDPCALSSTAWADVAARQATEQQIARAFLIDNYPIAGIRGRYMIDYDEPTRQTIPDIGDAATAR